MSNSQQVATCCFFCGVKTDALYELKEDGKKKLICLLCAEQQTELFSSDATVGFFGVRKHPRKCYMLLKRAVIKALDSDDEKLQQKAHLILKKMSESSVLVEGLYGSSQREDLKIQLRQQQKLVLIDSDKQVADKVKQENDNYPDIKEWERIYQSYKGKI
ncbi:hypothetical protein [Xenorhabdus sp. KJ12.1]|uniref:hypothetical protein n=1 Tax=Xenorhabdus sp. KJ12.1 TaxID=1851571 RepID=UPI000C0463E3|nr:hypothetical protein [Xenorhabdus sp. KJ12.1]PHM67992.1 hypothetical protein Xekj_03715 [Xenorhabdus sp. KJ12.1]